MDVTVIYYTTLEPFDRSTLYNHCKTDSIAIVEPFYKGTLCNGVVSALGVNRSARVLSIGVPRKFIRSYGTVHNKMWSAALPSKQWRIDLSNSLGPVKSLLFEDAKSWWEDLSVDLIRGRKVLVTGASGMLGSHFLAALLHLQQQLAGDLEINAVVHTSVPEWFAEESSEGRLHFHQADLGKAAAVDALPAADIVIHAATYSQPALFTRDPGATITLNTTATLALLDKVRRGGRFLFLSSSEVYSGLEDPPYREEQIGLTNTTHARACYIEGKRCGEAACLVIIVTTLRRRRLDFVWRMVRELVGEISVCCTRLSNERFGTGESNCWMMDPRSEPIAIYPTPCSCCGASCFAASSLSTTSAESGIPVF